MVMNLAGQVGIGMKTNGQAQEKSHFYTVQWIKGSTCDTTVQYKEESEQHCAI